MPGGLWRTREVEVRTIWNGSLVFRLVNVPVELALATQTQRSRRRTRSARAETGGDRG